MKSYMQMSREELLSLKASLEEEFKTEEAKGLSLNMARGSRELLSLHYLCRCWM